MAYVDPPRDVSDYDPRAEGARCDLCPCKDKAYVPFQKPSSGEMRLIVVGEGPGYKEEIRRVPFVGPSGSMVDDMLDEAGESRRDTYVTNAAMCRADTDQDELRASECCAPRLLRELAALPPEVPIVALGKSAARSILGVKSILLARGFVWKGRDVSGAVKNAETALRKLVEPGKNGKKKKDAARKEKIREARLRVQILTARQGLVGRTILPTIHPAFVLRSDPWTPILRIDMKRAGRIVRGELPPEKLDDHIVRVKSITALKRKEGTYIVTDSPDEIRQAMRLLGETVGVDIETEAVQPLTPLLARVLCVQISDGKRTIVIGPWDKRLHADAVTEVLAERTCVFHNGFNFDQPALEKDGVKFNLGRIEDTLTAHHTFASHMPQRLDHVVSTFLDATPWKIKHGRKGAEEKGLPPQHMDPDELYHYGAVDAVLTVLAWFRMQADLADEKSVYAHDKELGFQGKRLQVGGMRVDVAHREHLMKLLKARSASLKGRMRVIAKKPHFEPSRLGQVRYVLFRTLRAPMLNPTASGLASTSNATLEVLKRSPTRAGKLSKTLLDWRIAQKIRSTYLAAVHVHPDLKAHFNWRPYGTVSGRYSCRVQSCPRWSTAVEDRVREIYIADEGHDLWYFDLSQAEARFAANLSGDPNFIETCKGDVHVGNAKVLFAEAMERLLRDPKGDNCPRHSKSSDGKGRCNCGKPFRDISKNVGFAIAYLAEAPAVMAFLNAHPVEDMPVDLDAVVAMLDRLRSAYKVYYQYVAENVAFVQRHGYLRTAITGRLRMFGYYPKPQEVANLPIQSGIADVMNTRTLVLEKRLPAGARMVKQVHDAAIFTAPKRYTQWEEIKGKDGKVKKVARGVMHDLITETWAEPVRLKESIVCRGEREFTLPADIKCGARWSDFG